MSDLVMFNEKLLADRRILVTGGGTGLGKAMAGRFLSLGAEVHICSRRKGVCDETATELMDQFGGKVMTHGVDIRDAAAVDAMVEEIFKERPLTDLINNAAGNFISRTEELSPRGFDAVANIVMHGTFYVTHAVGRRWIAGRHRGNVVSITVTWVRNGSPYVVPSAMSKSAVHAMTMSLATEWGRYGIRLNTIAPGEIPTEGMSKRIKPGDEAGARTIAMNPMGRVGTMEELQNLATFLISGGCDWINGETIAMDGAQGLASGGNFYQLRDWSDADWNAAREAIMAQNEKARQARLTACGSRKSGLAPRGQSVLKKNLTGNASGRSHGAPQNHPRPFSGRDPGPRASFATPQGSAGDHRRTGQFAPCHDGIVRRKKSVTIARNNNRTRDGNDQDRGCHQLRRRGARSRQNAGRFARLRFRGPADDVRAIRRPPQPQVANGLAALGVRPGERVAISARTATSTSKADRRHEGRRG